MTAPERLRELLAGDELIVAPGVFDGISAALVAKLGFPAAYMTGAGVSAAHGLPDIGLLTLTEMADRARMLAGLLDVPLIADADTGYGSPINAIRAVREYERAGVAAIQLEDQVFPKRCGHLAGKAVVDADEFTRTLRAAVDAREQMLIVARTDALAIHGLDEAIRRGTLYAEAGADVIFIEAPQSAEQIERIAVEIDAPLLLNHVPGGRTPYLPPERLVELGIKIAIHPGAVMMTMIPAIIGSLKELRPGTADGGREVSPEAFFDLFGLTEWMALGARYDAGTEAVA